MNFEQAKALRLRLWKATLDDHYFRIENPEAHRSSLLECSARLAEEKLIDRMEQFDMDEMANAAYWHAVEELQSNPIMYRPSYGYDVVPLGGGPRIGTIFHSILSLDESRGDSLLPFDGKVYRDKEGLALKYSYSTNAGRIEGLVLTMEDGRQFDLVETRRMILGKVYKAIEDPDAYRWMVDVVQLATENRDVELVKRVRPFLELTNFLQCSTCLDHFGKRDICTVCEGLGFVPKPAISGYP
ncbi:hypothetical protein [Pseudomonas brassicacearum]|uniref:hypothetical protein n=1 Tax=Pseudomonas brassicacearum TaxID=930166 RepID=UPI0005B420D6|nr:hypothetical protein [Pseudomonas brassicacearum]